MEEIKINDDQRTFEELFAKALELAALEDIEEIEKAAAALPGTPIVIDVTGTPLIPGHPKVCLGLGKFPGFDLCCDECDHYQKCYPKWREGIFDV